MCGVFSIIKKNKDLNDESVYKNLDRAVLSLNSRGPDKHGKFSHNNLHFVHTRLSIIDLSENGNQPMQDQNGNAIIFNGEIYNHDQLRTQMINENGEKFFSNSDTEVILKGFKHYGQDIFNKLRGPFSIIIYEKNSRKIFFARDTFGMKPLYIFENKNFIILSSSVKSINSINKLKHLDIAKVLYSKYGFIPEPYTQYENRIRKNKKTRKTKIQSKSPRQTPIRSAIAPATKFRSKRWLSNSEEKVPPIQWLRSHSQWKFEQTRTRPLPVTPCSLSLGGYQTSVATPSASKLRRPDTVTN